MGTELQAPPKVDAARSLATEAALALPFRRRVKWIDRLARLLISSSGILIIAAILGIGVFLLAEVLPLFKKARFDLQAVYSNEFLGTARLVIVDEHHQQVLAIADAPEARVFGFKSGTPIASVALTGLENTVIRAASRYPDTPVVALATAQGKVWVGKLALEGGFQGSTYAIQPAVEQDSLIEVDPAVGIQHIAHRWGEAGGAIAAALDDQRVIYTRVSIRRPLIGAPTRTVKSVAIPNAGATVSAGGHNSRPGSALVRKRRSGAAFRDRAGVQAGDYSIDLPTG
jgi:hypothetical protein